MKYSGKSIIENWCCSIFVLFIAWTPRPFWLIIEDFARWPGTGNDKFMRFCCIN